MEVTAQRDTRENPVHDFMKIDRNPNFFADTAIATSVAKSPLLVPLPAQGRVRGWARAEASENV
jgi:hypothetical protein